jgi:hypothetical protein
MYIYIHVQPKYGMDGRNEGYEQYNEIPTKRLWLYLVVRDVCNFVSLIMFSPRRSITGFSRKVRIIIRV